MIKRDSYLECIVRNIWNGEIKVAKVANNFGLKIGLDGEKEFKALFAKINKSFKVLGSEMKLVESQFDKNDSSVEALTAKNKVLEKSIETQKKKIETLRYYFNRLLYF